MKKYFVRIISILVFLTLLGGCLARVSKVVERKDSAYKYRAFYEQEQDFDVLFMGTSHVINAVFPMEMWDKYGIVSYNFGGHGNQMATSYWVMMNALQYTHPKLVVIDVLEIGRDEKVTSNEDQSRLSIDSMPFSKVKVEAVKDMFGDKSLLGTEREDLYHKRYEFLFDFGKYHSRWNDLQKNDFDASYSSLEKGAETRVRLEEPMDYYIVPKEIKLPGDTVGATYLRKMIEECQSRGIEVLLTHVPYPAEEWHQEGGNTAYDIAEEYGVDYLNFVAMDCVANYETDCYDSHGHLNASGGKHVSDYLGKYIRENYDVPDRREDEAYASWYQDYEKYNAMKQDMLHGEGDLYNALMLLQDDDFDAMVYVKDGAVVSGDPKLHALLDNMLDLETEVTEEEYGDILAVVSRSTDTAEIAYGRKHSNEPLLETDTGFGKVVYKNCVDGDRYLLVGDEEQNRLDDFYSRYYEDETPVEPDVSIWVYDSKTGELLFRLYWIGAQGSGQEEKLHD